MLRVTTYILTLVMLIGCRTPDEHPFYGELPQATTTIASLRDNEVRPGGVFLGDDIVIRGRVISSDREENFYNALFVDDGTGALELRISGYNLAAAYPEGLDVALCLGGLYADYEHGVLQVGYQPTSHTNHAVADIASRQVIDRVVVHSNRVERVTPRITPIRELSPRDCGRLHYFEGLQLAESTSTDTPPDNRQENEDDTTSEARWRGYALLRTTAGDSIAIYTSENAEFADERIPTTPISVIGILEWAPYDGEEECYQLRMRYASDCRSY